MENYIFFQLTIKDLKSNSYVINTYIHNNLTFNSFKEQIKTQFLKIFINDIDEFDFYFGNTKIKNTDIVKNLSNNTIHCINTHQIYDKFLVYFKFLTGKTYSFDIPFAKHKTIEYMKKSIQKEFEEKTSFKLQNYRLIYFGNEMENHQLIGDFNFEGPIFVIKKN